MTVDQQGATARIRARQPRDHVAAPGRARLDIDGLVADLGELGGHVLGGLPLPHNRGRVAGVRRVDPDQVAGETDDLVFGHAGRNVHRAFLPLAGREPADSGGVPGCSPGLTRSGRSRCYATLEGAWLVRLARLARLVSAGRSFPVEIGGLISGI